MTGNITARLTKLNIELPKPRAPVANYVPAVISGNQIYIAGQVCSWNGEYRFLGRLGGEISTEEGQQAARLCGLNIIAQLQAALGALERVKRCVKLTVFIRSADTFTQQPQVANGASDLFVEVFGEAGRHARSAVGVSQLPFGVCIEIDSVFEIVNDPQGRA
jgi:enamine deaminase RidA (YjgF/YER057c/UK114 family)